jgi:hypothetical protein
LTSSRVFTHSLAKAIEVQDSSFTSNDSKKIM